MVVRRMCAVCRQKREKIELLRIVKFKDGEICIDLNGRMQGRGMYICRDKNCLREAEKRRVIQRNFSCPPPKEVYEKLAEMSGNYEKYE